MIIDNEWPECKLEHVNQCPYCSSTKRNLAFSNIQDWSFYASAGNWSYWNCEACSSLYLDPRPKASFIHEAYSQYYTHSKANISIASRIKALFKNEFFSHLFGINLNPRLEMSKKLFFLIKPLQSFLFIPFGMKQLVELPKGKLLDVGCGDGSMLKIARDLGWDVTGIEIDPQAVESTRKHGINVIQGSYHAIEQLDETYDCIICSHVLEHVYNPNEMLELIIKKLNSSGTLLLSCPNSLSHMREHFGSDWRGIEAPRHIAIPSLPFIENYFENLDFESVRHHEIFYGTYIESERIKFRKESISFARFLIIKLKLLFAKKPKRVSSDYIQIDAQKHK
jgi:2-polyprenyl-3-methyl-5-hydroxy-6-metoxy-1,4-benzoquinol methylase